MIRNSLGALFRSLAISESVAPNTTRYLFTSQTTFREALDRKEMMKSLPTADEGTAGEANKDIDTKIYNKSQVFPNSQSMFRLFDGVPFKDIPIFHIKVSRNNTILGLTSAKGTIELTRSCGVEGFKNTRKGTNVAAQATAITIGNKALERGIKMVRVKVQGLGPGRMSAIKGLEMTGLKVVSITDNTKVSWNPPRPRKQRKL